MGQGDHPLGGGNPIAQVIYLEGTVKRRQIKLSWVFGSWKISPEAYGV